MTDQVEEKAEKVAEIVENAIVESSEKTTEVEAQIAVAKAEAALEKAIDAANTLEMAATIQVANITQEAESKIAEHKETVENLEFDVEWAKLTINNLLESTAQIQMKMELLESKLLNHQPLTQAEQIPTVELEVPQPQNEVADDLQNPIQEIQQEVIPARKIKYRAL